MTRTQILQELINKYEYKSLLEIGVDTGVNRMNVKVENYTGVDPNEATPATHHMTSDEFFKQNDKTFDIIFVDGLHHADAVYRDILNSLEVLNEGGVIVCHDMSPIEELHQRVPRESRIWNGDCWKAWVQLRSEESELEMFVVDTDWGCGVIRRGFQTKLQLREELTFENLVINRNKWLNLKSIEDFLKIL